MLSIFRTFNDSIIEDIAVKCPQLKLVMDVPIVDIRNFDYEFPIGNDELDFVEIEGRNYYVMRNPLKKLLELLKREEVQHLNIPYELQDEIYQKYKETISNPKYKKEAMNHFEIKSTYEQHQNGEKVFTQMDYKSSIVATIAFTLYHYKIMQYKLFHSFYLHIYSKFYIYLNHYMKNIYY